MRIDNPNSVNLLNRIGQELVKMKKGKKVGNKLMTPFLQAEMIELIDRIDNEKKEV